MREHAAEVLRRQSVMHVFSLVFVGTGAGPGCHQQQAIFSRRRVTPGPPKERCLDCWEAKR